jgi:uncharacterized DUF497 family protein
LYDNIDVPIDGIEWNSKKARLNLETHKVSFETAQYIFADPERLERLDQSEGNTSGEERLQTLGMVEKVLFVSLYGAWKEQAHYFRTPCG